MIQAIFFDFNGVIIDDEPLQMKAYQEVFVPYGVPLSEAQYYDALGMDDRAFVQAAFERVGKELTLETRQAVSEAKVFLHRELMTDELPLFPGVVTFLKAAARSFSLGLVSMANREEIRYVFDRARWSLVLGDCSAEDVNVCKPAPDCYQRALNKLNEKRLNTGCYLCYPPSVWSSKTRRRNSIRTRRRNAHAGVTNTAWKRNCVLQAPSCHTESGDWNETRCGICFVRMKAQRRRMKSMTRRHGETETRG